MKTSGRMGAKSGNYDIVFSRAANNWVLVQTLIGEDRNGDERVSRRTTYHNTIEQALEKVERCEQ